MRRGYAERRERASPSPGGHLLGLQISPFACLNWRWWQGVCTQRNHWSQAASPGSIPEGCPLVKEPSSTQPSCVVGHQAELRGGRGSLTELNLSDRGTVWSLLPYPFSSQQAGGPEDLKTNRSSVQFSCSVASDSLRPHGLQHARLPCPSPTPAAAAAAKSLQSCPTLCDPIDGSPPGSPVSGIL